MKQVLFFLMTAFLMITVGCGSQDQTAVGVSGDKRQLDSIAIADTANYTAIEWIDSVNKDLGTMKEGQIVELSWRFKNAGTKPLVITNVSAPCGCTVPAPPKEPIAPGKEGRIEAKFDTKGQIGTPIKSVVVRANTNPQEYQLNFTGQVVKQ